jgi:hypothetical protein
MFDRFSNHPTPSASPGSRPYSPAPRKTSHLVPQPQRPQYGPRSSSLSRLNSSTESLPRATRTANGSALRQEISQPPSVEDPLETLRRIIGISVNSDDKATVGLSPDKPATLSADVEFGGLSLEAFVTEQSKGRAKTRPRAGTIRTVEECEYVHSVAS